MNEVDEDQRQVDQKTDFYMSLEKQKKKKELAHSLRYRERTRLTLKPPLSQSTQDGTHPLEHWDH